MSDIAQLKMLDGRPATFLRFNGPDRYVVLIDGGERTMTRAEWRGLVPHPSCSDANPQGNVERLGYDADCVAGTAPHYIVDRSRADRRDPNLAVCTVRSGAAALPINRRPRPIQKIKLSSKQDSRRLTQGFYDTAAPT